MREALQSGVEVAKQAEADIKITVKSNKVAPDGPSTTQETPNVDTVAAPTKLLKASYKPFIDGEPNKDFARVIIASMISFGVVSMALLVAMVLITFLQNSSRVCATSQFR
jgi:hypothetical protein